jgi:hypothetical protein
MEEAFGDASFGGVRVHADSRSDHLNRLFHAKAFTTGQDVFFRQGTFHPDSSRGRALIAHELAHVVQQKPGMQAVGLVQRYMKDDWANSAASLAAARTNRDNKRGEMQGWTGADHVSGAVLEYKKQDEDARAVKNLGSEVSGNPRSPKDESLYERQTLLGVSANCLCSEKRILSKVPGTIGTLYLPPRSPTLYLANEWTACGICEGRIEALRKDVPSLEVVVSAAAPYTGQANASTWDYAAQDEEQMVVLEPADPTSTREFKKPLSLTKKSAKATTPANIFDLLNEVDEDRKPPARKSRKKETQKALDQAVESSQASTSAAARASATSATRSKRVPERGPRHTVTQAESAALESQTGLKLAAGAVIFLALLMFVIYLATRG